MYCPGIGADNRHLPASTFFPLFQPVGSDGTKTTPTAAQATNLLPLRRNKDVVGCWGLYLPTVRRNRRSPPQLQQGRGGELCTFSMISYSSRSRQHSHHTCMFLWDKYLKNHHQVINNGYKQSPISLLTNTLQINTFPTAFPSYLHVFMG